MNDPGPIDPASHLGLVFAASGELGSLADNRLEILGEVYLGVHHAAGKYDPTRGSFSHYAWRWIRRHVQVYRSQQRQWIRFPRHVCEEVDRAAEAERSLSHRLGRPPSEDEILDAAGVAGPSRSRVASAWRIFGDPRDADMPPSPVADPARVASDREESLRLAEAVAALIPAQRRAIEAVFGIGGVEPMLLKEIAAAEGCTYQCVQNRVERGLRNLRAALGEGKSIKESA